MFLKQYNHKPRQNSKDLQDFNTNMADNNNDATSTGGKGASSSHNSQPGATRGGASQVPTPANSDAPRRKSSGAAYSGLAGLKRGTGDPEAEAKKASFMEQKPGSSNPISNMWNNFTKGPTGSG